MRTIIPICLFLVCSACTDPAGVRTFAGMAPDKSTIIALTDDYSREFDYEDVVSLAAGTDPDTNLKARDEVRSAQAKQIQQIDTTIREYMLTLGALADDKIVQSTTDVKKLTDGFTALQKAEPSLGITNDQIASASGLVQLVANIAESGYRSVEFSEIIGKAEEPLQTLISIQIKIVKTKIEPGIQDVDSSIKAAYNVDQYIQKDISQWDKKANPNLSPKPTFQMPGATDAHVARYLLRRSFDSDRAVINAQFAAADAYITALEAIAKAHHILYEKKDDVLSKATFSQIKPLAEEAYKAYQKL